MVAPMALKWHLPWLDSVLRSLERDRPASNREFSVRDFQILFLLFQFALVVSIAAYLPAVRVMLDRRNHRTWEQLAVRLKAGSGEVTLFRNAGVMLEMADYARHSENPIDAVLAATLRGEALRVRLAVVWACVPWA